jgi:CRP/FNR family transcriptional regulator, anaerobic regulatory protein
MEKAHMNTGTEHHAIMDAALRIPRERAPVAGSPSLLKQGAVRCSSCAMRSLCMPVDLAPRDFAHLDSIIGTTRTVLRGESLFRANDHFQSLYAVRAGSFKTLVMHRDGGEQVTGLHLPGDPLGLDGVCNGHHACDAVALEDSTVCVIPFALLDAMCREVKPMQHHLYRMMSSALVRDAGLVMVLGMMSAEQRVASLLLNLSERFGARGYSRIEFTLRMTREEMGSYLGMKLETVSRMFSRFQKEGLLETHGKKIRLLDLDGLARV